MAYSHYLFYFMCYNIHAKRYPPTYRARGFEADTPAAGYTRIISACARDMQAMRAAQCREAAGGASLPRRNYYNEVLKNGRRRKGKNHC